MRRLPAFRTSIFLYAALALAITSVAHPQNVKLIDLGDTTLLHGLIDAHVHLFLHPGAEDLQTVEESVPWRVILAAQAAKEDLTQPPTNPR